jgi:hypothetical protein
VIRHPRGRVQELAQKTRAPVLLFPKPDQGLSNAATPSHST